MEKLNSGFSWSRFYALRKEVRRSYPSVYRIKIKKKLLDVINGEIVDEDSILDVGASDRSLGDKITARYPSITYKTMDIDKTRTHDYYSLDDVSESFNMIILSEVIEHLEFADGISMLGRLFELLKRGGRIIVSTPNLHHPNRYWWDTDHKTPYRYDVLGAALLSAGFTVDRIFRTYNDQIFRRFIRMYIAMHLHRYLDIDFAKSIIAVASKR